MGSPFYNPENFQSAAPSATPSPAAANELSQTSLNAIDGGAGHSIGVTPDVHSQLLAAANGTPVTSFNFESVHFAAGGAASQAQVAAEAAHLLSAAAHMPAAVGEAAAMAGHAAIGGAAAAGAEATSPLIQLIMKMPGAMGMMNDFFDFLMKLFNPENLTDLITGLDPVQMMNIELGEHLASIHSFISETLENVSLNLSHLPADPSLIHSLTGSAHGIVGNFEITQAIPAEHFLPNANELGGAAGISNPQFEGVGAHDAAIAGPAVTHTTSPSFISGNHRLFADQLDKAGSGNLNTMVNNTTVPSTAVPAPSANAPTFGAEATPSAVSRADVSVASPSAVSDAGAGSQLAAQASPVGDIASSAPSANNMIASDVPSYRPTMGANNYYSGGSEGATVEPLRAKQLTFEDIKKGTGDHSQTVVDLKKSAAPAASAQSAPAVKHAAAPAASHTPSHVAHHSEGAAATAKPVHHIAHHAAKPTVHAESTQIAQASPGAEASNSVPGADTNAASDATAGADAAATPTDATGAYTVHQGDSLWNIAEKQLGDGSRWTEIYKLNSNVIGQNPDLIFSGTNLKLPGMPGGQIADAAKYVVKPGDSLWSISQQNLHGGQNWGDLYKANSSIIGANPRFIVPGQELTLPGAQPSIAQAVPTGADVAAAPAAVAPQMTAVAPSMSSAPMMQQAAPAFEAPAQPMVPVAQAAPVAPSSAFGSPMQLTPVNAPAEAIPATPTGVIQVEPAHQPMAMGPGAAGAATLDAAGNSVVNSSIGADIASLLGRKPQ